MFFTFLKLHKRYQITQSITYMVIWRTLKQLKTRYLFPFFLFYLQNLILKVLNIYGRRMTQLNSLIINFINSRQMWKIERNYGSGKILLVAYDENLITSIRSYINKKNSPEEIISYQELLSTIKNVQKLLNPMSQNHRDNAQSR